MNDKQKAFCHALLKNKFNQTKAYKEAYPDCKTDKAAKTNASRLLTNAYVQEYLAELTDRLDEEELITEKEIIQGIIDDIDGAREHKQYSASIKGRELLGKYKKMFTDKVEHSGKVRKIITFGEASEDE